MDGEHRLIVAMGPTSNVGDRGAPMGLPDEVRNRFGAQPRTALAGALVGNELEATPRIGWPEPSPSGIPKNLRRGKYRGGINRI